MGVVDPARTLQARPEVDLTVVVPFFNPGPALAAHVSEVAATLSAAGVSFEVIAVSDGSTDGSPASLEGLLPGVLRRVELPHAGKGHALRAGLAQGRGRYLGFIDADGDIPARELETFVAALRSRRPEILTGSKRHPASEVVYPPLRRFYSAAYQLLLKCLFDLSVEDTQTGIKLVRRDVLATVLPYLVEERYAFDLELFVVARHLGYRQVEELPVRIRRRFSSTISVLAVLGILRDTLAIYWRLRWRHSYDRPVAGRVPEPPMPEPPMPEPPMPEASMPEPPMPEPPHAGGAPRQGAPGDRAQSERSTTGSVAGRSSPPARSVR